MLRSLARYSASVSFVQAPFSAAFITTTVGFKFSVRTGDRATALIEDIRCEKIRGCSYIGGNMSASDAFS